MRPEGLPENFRTVGDLANSYRELQQKLTELGNDNAELRAVEKLLRCRDREIGELREEVEELKALLAVREVNEQAAELLAALPIGEHH